MISIVLHLYLKVIFEKKNTFRPIYFEICYVYNKSYAIPYSIKLQAHACSESNPLPFQWRSFRYRDMDSHLSNMVRGCMQILIFWLYFQGFFLIWNMWVVFFYIPFLMLLHAGFYPNTCVDCILEHVYINKTCINMYSMEQYQMSELSLCYTCTCTSTVVYSIQFQI